MEWEMDAARNSLMTVLVFILILSFAGLLLGGEVLREPPREFAGGALGSVSLCIDISPELVLDNLTVHVHVPYYYNVSENITSTPYNLTIYYYIKNDTIPNPNFNITWETGIINFTPNALDIGTHTVIICATHDFCYDVEDCETIAFTVTELGAPIWNESIPDFEINESQTIDGGPDWFYNINDSIYVRNITLTDYVYEPDGQTMNFTAIRIGGNISIRFPAFNLNSDTGIIEIIDADDPDVGNHTILIIATDTSSNFNYSNSFLMMVLNVINDAPIIYPIPLPIQYICEDVFYNYTLNATDPDPDQNVSDFTYDEYNWTTFYMNYENPNAGRIYFTPREADVGNHTVYIAAKDNIDPNLIYEIFPVYTVMRVNDYPNFTFNSIIFPDTIEGHDYYFDMNATDEEEVNESSGNLTFTCNISWINNSMNHTTGVINTTIPDNTSGTNNIRICVADIGIDAHPNAESYCGEKGDPKQTCVNTFINIGNNTQPEIISWHPENLTIRIKEKQIVTLWVNFTDFENTSLHVYWRVNGDLRKYEISSPKSPYPLSKFVFRTDYSSSGVHEITATVNDGGFLDSITWEVFVENVPEAVTGGSGGGGSTILCTELWECSKWTACQRMTNDIVYPLRGELLEDCREEDVPERHCGYKTRFCNDANNCGTNFTKPEEIRGCYFTFNPNCYDGISNCHHGSCEIGIDCGGPCDPCPTCQDGIMNHGEKGIDCGGPCMPCEPGKELPFPECGNRVCRLGELFSCTADCWTVWITVILILTTLLSFKVGLGKIEKLKEKRLERGSIEEIEALSEDIEKAIESKDIVLARKLYSKSREIFKKLPPPEKLRMYSKLAKSHNELKKYDVK
ncbi:MAG: hypothetical protein JSW73_03860 [Candidatus Woesearchaeota archaeon]|nr:MAG: hypothetical protein JSW73_03860 [Candidatus Woesearchaeota archaeon]